MARPSPLPPGSREARPAPPSPEAMVGAYVYLTNPVRRSAYIQARRLRDRKRDVA